MKLFILLLFTFTTPLVVFLSTLLFASDINEVLKKELVKNGIYNKITEQITTLVSTDTETQIFTYFIKQKFTSKYIQTKTDGAIDSSADWITGKSATKPTVSFKDLKEDILTQNPGLLTSIEEMANEMKNQPVDESWAVEEQQSTEDMQKNMDSMVNLAKSDWTLKLDQYLVGLKDFYSILRFLVPILAILLVVYLVLLFKLSQSFILGMKWLSTALILSSALGFAFILSNNFLLSALTSVAAKNSDTLIRIISPIVIQILTYFADKYLLYQGITSGVFLLAGAACLVIAGLRNDPVPVTQKSVQKLIKKPRVSKK